MASETTANPGICYRCRVLLRTDTSLVAKLTPGAAVQLGIKVFVQVGDDTGDSCG